ncbi:hypothetical protein [Paenibacillus segetis]|nr:hypothetical protein [Paenibacillus segetis]
MLKTELRRTGIATTSIIAITFCIVLMMLWGRAYLLPHAYTYHEAEDAQGIKIHALVVKPESIELRAAERPLNEYHLYGMNGGFFYEDAVLSIAVNNDVPVKGAVREFGSGWFNAKYKRGTLVWDEVAGRFSIQVVSSADEIDVRDRGQYFAQGGVSMSLQDEANWSTTMEQEHLPAPDERRLRSGLVYDDSGLLWLIVTPTHCTAEEFRDAIQNTIAPGSKKEGIFLDGDGSSQLNSAEIKIRGDSRNLQQIIAIK